MLCSKCGKEIKDGSTLCPYCGNKEAGKTLENAQKPEDNKPADALSQKQINRMVRRLKVKTFFKRIFKLIITAVIIFAIGTTALVLLNSSNGYDYFDFSVIKSQLLAVTKGTFEVSIPADGAAQLGISEDGNIPPKYMNAGFKEVINNGDGTVTVITDRKLYNKYRDALHQYNIDEFERIKKYNSYFETFKYNHSFTKIECYVDRDKYDADKVAEQVAVIKLNSRMYNCFTRNLDMSPDDISVTIYDYITDEPIE